MPENTLPTIHNALKTLQNQLNVSYDGDEARRISQLVLEWITGFSTARLLAFGTDTLTHEHNVKLQSATKRIITGEPIQYVLGEAWFRNLPYVVTPAVLIPRPETEELVDWIVQAVKIPNPKILDIGTGSGCIAISLALEINGSQVNAWDISVDAIAIASQNATRLKAKVDFVQADALNTSHQPALTALEVIVSNPPYVLESEKELMHRNVLDHEPHTALFVPNNEALLFYDAIARLAIKSLASGGYLFFEINEQKGEAVVSLLQELGFDEVELKADLFGKYRMVKARQK